MADALTPDTALKALAAVLAPLVAAELSKAKPSNPFEGMIDQRASVLGPRRHARRCRALLAKGDPRAARVGRRWLLTPDAVQEALAELGKCEPEPATDDDDLAAVAERLGLTITPTK